MKNKNKILILSFLVIFFIFIFHFFLPNLNRQTYSAEQGVVGTIQKVAENILGENTFKRERMKTPEKVKTIYMSACVAATPSMRNNLMKLVEQTELNSIIIDIKDYSGTISFKTDNSKLVGMDGPGCIVKDMKEFIQELHDRDIYVIGRITVFQDAYYATLHPDLAVQNEQTGQVWKDHKGISFIDVSAKPFWEYIVDLSKESYKIGFDELNFDYIRFPSDGNMKVTHYPHSAKILEKNPDNGRVIALENFFKYLSEELEGTDVATSADLFGMVTTVTSGDLGIGQRLENSLAYFDYIAPMIYPSHYPSGFNGWSNPNNYPYELIKHVMDGAVEKINNYKSATSTPEDVRKKVSINQLRPWLQDFDYGGNYGAKEVRAQIQATYDAGVNSWMLWDPANRYTPEALLDR